MASTTTTGTSSVVYERHSVHRWHWPAQALNFWILIMMVASCLIIGVFATFIQIQQILLLNVPWYFPYMITVASLAVFFIIMILWLIFQRKLLPSVVMIGGFIMFILWLVGLIVVSVQLWGPAGSISGNCNLAVFSQAPTGQSLETLAWLEQRNICQSWQAVFSFALVGVIFWVWIMVMAYQVFAGNS